MSKELEQTEIKVQKIIKSADESFETNNYHLKDAMSLRYYKENMRCNFLKIHLKAAFETIEHMKRMEKANNEFYTKLLQCKENES
ncbi:MAG: hypothetical protein V3V72_13450 [Ignavibacteriaceae bacterium]